MDRTAIDQDRETETGRDPRVETEEQQEDNTVVLTVPTKAQFLDEILQRLTTFKSEVPSIEGDNTENNAIDCVLPWLSEVLGAEQEAKERVRMLEKKLAATKRRLSRAEMLAEAYRDMALYMGRRALEAHKELSEVLPMLRESLLRINADLERLERGMGRGMGRGRGILIMLQGAALVWSATRLLLQR